MKYKINMVKYDSIIITSISAVIWVCVINIVMKKLTLYYPFAQDTSSTSLQNKPMLLYSALHQFLVIQYNIEHGGEYSLNHAPRIQLEVTK